MSPKDMYVRGTVWYATIWFYNPKIRKRDSLEWSTGIKISGKKDTDAWNRALDRAIIEAGKKALEITLGTHNSSLTIADAYAANHAGKVSKGCAPATFEILSEKWPHIQAYFGDNQVLKSIEDVDMIKFVGAMKEGKTNKKQTPQTPGSVARAVKELFYGMNILKISPMPKFPEVGKLTKGTRNLGRAQFAKLIAHVNPRFRDHVLTYRLTGMRKDELYTLEAKHVDVSENMLTVPGSDSVNGDNDRCIPIHEQLMPILLRRVKAHPRGPLFDAWNNADRDLREAGVRAQVGLVSFNVIKASFGAELLRADVPARDVAEFYGHSSTRMVEEHYNRLQAGKHLTARLSKIKSIPISTDDNDEE